jgi:hypothetical protein
VASGDSIADAGGADATVLDEGATPSGAEAAVSSGSKPDPRRFVRSRTSPDVTDPWRLRMPSGAPTPAPPPPVVEPLSDEAPDARVRGGGDGVGGDGAAGSGRGPSARPRASPPRGRTPVAGTGRGSAPGIDAECATAPSGMVGVSDAGESSGPAPRTGSVAAARASGPSGPARLPLAVGAVIEKPSAARAPSGDTSGGVADSARVID